MGKLATVEFFVKTVLFKKLRMIALLNNVAVAHDDNGVTHGKGFFLIVRNVNKGNAQAFMHSFEFKLHFFSYLRAFCPCLSARSL